VKVAGTEFRTVEHGKTFGAISHVNANAIPLSEHSEVTCSPSEHV
jgi:hypothetical protein